MTEFFSIWSLEQVQKHISLIPEPEVGEAVLVMLMVRTKLAKSLVGVKVKDTVLEYGIVIKKDINDNWRERLLKVIKRFAVLKSLANELYTIEKEYGVFPCPPETCAICVVMNPAKCVDAIVDFIKETVDLVVKQRNVAYASKVQKRFFGCLHRRTRHILHCFDIDTKQEGTLEYFLEVVRAFGLEKAVHMVLETRGGYHVLIDTRIIREEKELNRAYGEFLGLVKERTIDKMLQNYCGIVPEPGKRIVEFNPDAQEPVAGTLYGNFPVKILYSKF